MTEKKHSKIKLILFFIVLLVLFVGTMMLISAYNKSQEAIVLEAKEKEIILKSEEDKKKEEELRLKQEEERKRREEQEKALLPGFNHNRKAEAYAYDTGKICRIIQGEEEYSGEKLVFLTFDDGVNDSVTPLVLDVLKEKQVPATFFVVGGNLTEELAPILQREIEEGHAVGLHSQTHNYSYLYPNRVANPESIRQEVLAAQGTMQEYLGEDFHSGVFRYPGGHMSWENMEATDRVLEELGMHWIDWNALVGDAEPESVRPTTEEEMLDFLKMTIDNNWHQDIQVVLMHDGLGKYLTLNTLPQIIDYFKEEGYAFGILQ